MIRENLAIKFKPGEIWLSDKHSPLCVIKCADEHQDDVYFYLLGALPDEIKKGIRGSIALKQDEAKAEPAQP